jgi:hypothetical protein
MSADGYRLVPEQIVISEPLMKTGLVEDYRTHINPDHFQDQKELELALAASEEAAKKVDLPDALVLKLSYKNICDIDHLEAMDKLHTLCLDNNIIGRIENLGHLTNLIWLDLSFNNITKIEGLETLVNLKDLTLYHNQIEHIENLDMNQNIECLSLGKNRVKSLDCVSYLRGFPKLRMLNLEGNAICNEEEYRLYVVGFISQLDYLDFVMVGEDERVRALETFQDELMILQEKEVIEKTTKDREEAQKAETKLLKQANLLVVQNLFEEMLEEDSELSKLRTLPGVNEMLEDFQDKCTEACEEFRALGLEQYELRKKELSTFSAVVESTKDKAAAESRVLVEQFLIQKNSTIQDVLSMINRANEEDTKFSGIDDIYEGKKALQNLKSKVNELRDLLIGIEVKQLEVQDKILNEFETKYGEIKNKNLELQNICFRKVEDCETAHSNALSELCNSLAEKLSNGELDHLPEETRELIGNKEVLDTAIQGSNDIHIGKLLSKEDETRAEEMTMFKATLQGFKDDKLLKSRARLAEINRLAKEFKTDIQSVLMEISEANEDDYDDGEEE